MSDKVALITGAATGLELHHGTCDRHSVGSTRSSTTTSSAGTYAGYRLSKAALNALTRNLHAALEHTGIRVNAVCPGHVKTAFGGPSATREVFDGAKGVVWAATLEPGGPSGGFFRDGEAIAW